VRVIESKPPFDGGVSDEIGQTLNAVDGAHVDDAAAFCFAHAGDSEFRDVEGAAQVDLHHFFPKVGGGFLETGTGKPAGVV